MIDKEKLKRRFSRNARQYDRYAAVQKITAQTLMNSVKADGVDYRDILEIGCGTGHMTGLLAAQYPMARITAVDIADGMIDYATARLDNPNITFLCADVEEMTLTKTYDLIVSNATFQWFNHLEDTLVKLTSHLCEGGKLSFSTFGSETFKELHEAFRMAKSALGIQSDVAPGQSFMTQKGLLGICHQSENCQVSSFEAFEKEYFDTCLDFLNAVKKIGANKSQSESVPVPGLIEAVMDIYDKRFKEEALNQIYTTYHCLYFNLIHQKRSTK